MNSKYSILIPAFKRRYLYQTIQSCLNQTEPDFEIIIVDDASPENLFEIVEPFLVDNRVSYFRNEVNFGAENVVDNWNKCLSYSDGEYVICIGDDDELLPECLEQYDSLIEIHPDLGVYHTLTEIIDENGEIIDMQESRPEFESSFSYIWHRFKGRKQFIGDFCFNSALLKRNGGFFSLPLAWGSDDISAYIASKGDDGNIVDGIANTQIPGFRYRSSAGTITSSASVRLKLEAGIAYQKWFIEEFKTRETDGVYLPLLQKMLPEEMFSLTNLVRQEIDVHKGSVVFLLKNRKHFGINSKMIFKYFIISFAR